MKYDRLSCKSTINVLIVGRESLYRRILFKISHKSNYIFELINTKDEAIQRLQHNNYDILIMQSNGIKGIKPIDLLKMSYAMGKPSIILYNNFFDYLYNKFCFGISTFYRNNIFVPIFINHLFDRKLNYLDTQLNNSIQNSKGITLHDIYNNLYNVLKYNLIQIRNSQ